MPLRDTQPDPFSNLPTTACPSRDMQTSASDLLTSSTARLTGPFTLALTAAVTAATTAAIPACTAAFTSALGRSAKRAALLGAALALLGACALKPPGPGVSAPQQTAGDLSGLQPIAVVPARQAVTTAHPLATQAAIRMLDLGGSAIDAAVAAQMVLGLVEPQSSGIGGGSLLMHWDAQARSLTSHDGLAAAPAKVTAALSVDVDGSALRSADLQRGGRSVGVPGTLAVLKQVHARHGKLPWQALFAPAIELAEGGFPMPAYLHGILSLPNAAADHPDMLALYFGADGKPLPVGARLRNPAYAATLRRVAVSGPAALWAQGAAAALIASVQRGYRHSLMTEPDLMAYQAQQREPVCAPFLAYKVCMMAPPSFGGVVVLQVLQMLESRVPPVATGMRFSFDDPEFLHVYAEAGRLAQADRLRHVGDPGFVRVPLQALVSPDYVRGRARLIDANRMTSDISAGDVLAGGAASPESAPPLATSSAAGLTPTLATPGVVDAAEVADATSQLAIVDRAGNALSMTTTNNLNFGSRLMVDGYVLNNAMTNFSAAPRAGQAAPNRMEAGKRPVTSMAPTIVFDQAGMPVVVGGSAGGGQIVDYISASLVEMLANGRSPAQALAMGHVSTAVKGRLQLEKGSNAALMAPALAAKGHTVDIVPMTSGLGFLKRQGDDWLGAADPRRDGVALGR
jgi:gamma-glutamyltranspeptidase/glutathione hydrolase